MSEEQSVTAWLEQLKANEPAAVSVLWQRYLEQLIRLARRKLGALPRRAADEEDVALSAFAAFVDGVREGRFARLDHRDDLWQVLVMLTERKAIGLRRREGADKRGAGQVRGSSALESLGASQEAPAGLDALPAQRPTPEFAAEAREQLIALLHLLDEEPLRKIALAKLAGYTHREIADRLQLGVRSVERKLDIIRRKWQQRRV
jgi:RNA polymerase sigma factor (sigma-70 family)